MVKQEDLRRFARRDRTAVADARLDYWADQYRRHGGEAARRASTALLEHARRVQPGYPSDTDRAEDLSHHVRLSDCLHRTGRALPSR